MLLSLEELFGFLSPSMNLNNFNQIRNDIIQDYLTDLSMPSLYSWPLASLLRCLLSIEKIFPPPKITRLRLNLINYRFFLVTFILVCSVRIHEDFIKLLQRRIHLRHVTLYLKKSQIHVSLGWFWTRTSKTCLCLRNWLSLGLPKSREFTLKTVFDFDYGM